jgi:hypothetical protein
LLRYQWPLQRLEMCVNVLHARLRAQLGLHAFGYLVGLREGDVGVHFEV